MLLGGNVCGHINASSDDVPWVYIQPMRPILQDISQSLGAQDARILTHDHPLVVKIHAAEQASSAELRATLGNLVPTAASPSAESSAPPAPRVLSAGARGVTVQLTRADPETRLRPPISRYESIRTKTKRKVIKFHRDSNFMRSIGRAGTKFA